MRIDKEDSMRDCLGGIAGRLEALSELLCENQGNGINGGACYGLGELLKDMAHDVSDISCYIKEN